MSDRVIAVAGAPNVGKSTLFNALTGSRVAVGNWPGTSVEYSHSQWQLDDGTVTLIDLPGAYSLDPLSADEQLAADVLLAEHGPAVVIVIADAAHLARSLYLVAQLREHVIPLVVAVTMLDVARRQGQSIDIAALQNQIGVPTIAVDPRHRLGLDALRQAVESGASSTITPRSMPDVDDFGIEQRDLALEDDRFAWIDTCVAASTKQVASRRANLGDRIDKVVASPATGLLVFLVALWLLFQATTFVAVPLQRLLSSFFAGPLSHWVIGFLGIFGLRDTWLQGLLVDGLIAGVGTLLSFIPLMAIIFVLLALLEDSGYLARVAVVMDFLMRRLGLPGQAFLPLVVGFGCNVPGVAATRILSQPRQRLLTTLLVPFTSCSARLTVYLLITSIFFGQWAGTVVFVMYVVSVILVIGIGLLLRHTVWRDMPDPPLIMDLPPYQRPTLALTASMTWLRLKDFLQTASGVIVGAVLAVWVLQATPAGSRLGGFGHVSIDHSVYAVLARAIAPIFTLAGYGVWQVASALVVGFVAKEAIISSFGQIFALPDPSASGAAAGLPDLLRQTFETASGGHPNAAVAAFLVFLLAYTPCAATIAAMRREVGGRWTLFGVAMQLSVAWVLAVVVFQIGSRL